MPDNHKLIDELFQKIESLFLNGELEEALEVCEQAVQFNIGHPAAHRNMGVVLLEMRDLDRAVLAFEEALDLAPDYLDVFYPLAVAYKGLGRLQEALDSCDHAIRINPKFALAHNYRALVLNELGRFNEAMNACDKALMFAPRLPQAYNSRGMVLKAVGRFEEALKSYDRAIELAPGNADMHCNRAILLKDIGKLDEACISFRSALEINHDMVIARYFLASIEGADLPKASHEAYVEELFDSYAGRFEDDLVNNLEYIAPKLIYDAVYNHLPYESKKSMRILDLGCGTGLCGELFAAQANCLIGVDLSSHMLVHAEEKSKYTELIKSDIAAYLDQVDEQFDLVLSADVFVYIGDLGAIFSNVSKILPSGGMFAFTIESNESVDDYLLCSTGRYTHNPVYVNHLCEKYYFKKLICDPITVRNERGVSVAGNLFLLERNRL